MSHCRLRVAIVVGSTREGRFGDTIARWVAAQVGRRDDLIADLVDLAEARLPTVLRRVRDPAVEAFAARIAAADAIVVVTPEYNNAYPAALKQAIDSIDAEWRRKPVGFVCYGGRSGGLRAVEQLRLVFARLGAATVADTVSFHGARSCFDAAGEPLDPVGAGAAAAVMLDELVWWAAALRAARRAPDDALVGGGPEPDDDTRGEGIGAYVGAAAWLRDPAMLASSGGSDGRPRSATRPRRADRAVA